jgi:hypothetical protein
VRQGRSTGRQARRETEKNHEQAQRNRRENDLVTLWHETNVAWYTPLPQQAISFAAPCNSLQA